MTDISSQLFAENGNGLISLIYPPDEGMYAKSVGEAILGMQLCLEEIAKVAKLDDLEIVVFPVEDGSFKTVFAFLKKDGWKIVVGLDIVFNLFNNGFDVIEHFGANKAHNLDTEVLQYVQDPNVLALCRSKNFIYGSQKIVGPLSEEVQKVEIRYGEGKLEIKCENKQKYFEELEKESIFPELRDGEEVTIAGEITRINKGYDDLGFKYKDRTLKCTPFDSEISATQFHEFLEENQVLLTGVVKRSGPYDLPELKVISISKIESQNQASMFEQSDQ